MNKKLPELKKDKYTFTLSKQTKEILDTLSIEARFSRSKILELLVEGRAIVKNENLEMTQKYV